MKINCDVCNKDEASVFCSADDAALCAACDHRVHHANVLARKHPRFSLLLPSPKDSSLCDICQEKKGLLFCQQDRAILCKDCDVAIHKVNEHTMNHCRFLLTNVKLSTESLEPTTRNRVVPDLKPKFGDQEQVHVKKHVAPIVNAAQTINEKTTPKSNGLGHGSVTASSISEYLIETLPGWHVEDFLDSPPTFFEVDEDDPRVFWDHELLKGSMDDCFSHETTGFWIPQAPQKPAPAPPPAPPRQLLPHNSYNDHLQLHSNMGLGSQMISGSSLVFAPSNLNKITTSSEKRRFDDGNCFRVPQINPRTMTKKSRLLRY